MTTSVAISSDQAARYYRHYRKENAKEYYLEGEVDGEWAGKAAAALGLAGSVTGKDFKAVLDGRHAGTDEQLVRGSSSADGKRAAGWDVTFAAPKSVSLVALIGRDERALRAHDEATRVALAAVEELARARVSGRKRGDLSGNIVAALFRHETSRDLDPHLHTHSVIVNLTKNAQGKWVALDSTALFELQRYGTAVYRSALAAALLAAGYDLRHGEHGQLEIAGITEEQITHFSKRHEAIWAALRAEGRSDPEAQQRIQRASRKRKQNVGREALAASWDVARHQLGIDFRTIIPSTRARAAMVDPMPPAERAREAIDYAITHVTEREAVVTKAAIVEAALSRRLGYVALGDAERELDIRINRGELVENHDHPEFVTTGEMLALERAIVAHLGRARNTVAPISDAPDFSAFSLSESQATAAAAMLATRDRLTGLHGVAGAGKTYTLKAVKAEAERAGLIVRGFAPTTGATQELAKSDIASTTVAALLASPGAARGRELWIIDEASLLSTKQLHRLLTHAETAQARVILVGDTRQHTSVEAGSPFRLLLTAGMNRAVLDELRRQQESPRLLSAVEDASQGRAGSAVQRLEAMDAITEVADWDKRHEAIADRYTEKPDGTLIVAPSNKERGELNLLIRDRMRGAAKLTSPDVTVRTLVALDLTGVERTVAAKYQLGNIVRYRRGSRKYQIAKDGYAVVVGRDVARNLLTVRLPNGETRTYDPKRLEGVDAYAEETREVAAGERIQFRAVLRRPKIPNGALATIETLAEDGTATIRLDDTKKTVTINLKEARHFDYGYAVTSYSSQGKTVDRALVAARTRHAVSLVNSAQFYVSISRARRDVEIFTDSREQLPRAVAREATKHSALTFRMDLSY